MTEIDRAPDGRRIITRFEYPPIPIRSFDWSAVLDDYDGTPIDESTASRCPIGHGATEAEAVADLLAQIEDESE